MLLKGRVANIERVTFTKHLATMLKSGIPISEALELLSDQTTNSYFKQVIKTILANINNGKTLTEAISKYPRIFDNLYVNMVKTGELSGNLEDNLEYLSEKLHKDYLFKQKVASASTYPAIIVLVAILAIIQVSLFVLPKLTTLLESMEIELPLTTKILIGFSKIMRNYGIEIFAGLFILYIIFRFLITVPSIKLLWQKLLLNLPVLGQFLTNIQMTSACRNTGIMLKSGIPISESIKATSDSLSNLVFRNYFNKIYKSVIGGSSIGNELKKSSYKHFPKIAAKMIEVGERTGKLDETLLYMGDYFDNEVDTTTKNLSTILEPILLLGIGLFVAFLALAIISPIYKFTGSISQ